MRFLTNTRLRLRSGRGMSRTNDELSADFHAISARLTNASGIKFQEFRRTLKPRYGRVWTDILMGHAGLALIGVGLWMLPLAGWP